MTGFRALLLLFVLALPVVALPIWAEELSALARLDAGRSSVVRGADSLRLALELSQPVPWRLRPDG